MKIICLPYQSQHFYLKPDTALLRSGGRFFIPDTCKQLSGAMALVIKINRLGRHIAPRFAHRYYSETALGFSLYAADTLEQSRAQGLAWGSACSYDYSAPLSDTFIPLDQTPIENSSFAWEAGSSPMGPYTLASSVDAAIAHISQYIFLKMGDLIFIELHTPALLLPEQEIRAHRNNEWQLSFLVK